MAALSAYTLVFAIFPALIFLVAVLDLAGWFVPVIEDAVRWVGEQPADSPWRSLEAPLDAVLKGSTPAWAMLVFGGLITLWTAGNYVGGYQWAVGRIRRIPAGHPFVKQRLMQHALAIGAFVVILVTVVIVVFTGPVAEHLGDRIGLGDTTRFVWSWLRWPILFVVVSLLFAVFYQVTPGARRERSGLFTTGGAVAVIGWLLFTGGFSLYVKYFADYNRLYGTLGAFIAFLIWLYLFNVALLAATEIDAALEEVRAKADAGEPPGVHIGSGAHRLRPAVGRRDLARLTELALERLLGVEHRRLELDRLGEHQHAVEPQFAGGQDLDRAVAEHPAEHRLAQDDVVDLLQRRVLDVLAQHPGDARDAPVGDHVHLGPPLQDVPAEDRRRYEQEKVAPLDPRLLRCPLREEVDDEEDRAEGEQRHQPTPQQKHPVLAGAVQDRLVLAELLQQVLDAHGPSRLAPRAPLRVASPMMRSG